MDTILQQYALLEQDEQQLCIQEMKQIKNITRMPKGHGKKRGTKNSLPAIGINTMTYMDWIQNNYGGLYHE